MNMTERIADIWDAWLESDGTRRDYDKFEMAMKECQAYWEEIT